ncbi:MAG: hypothetical protein ACR2NP_22245 [Pirellulaceae bacterium]
MISRRFVLFVFVVASLVVGSAGADVVYLRDQQPVFGRVVRQDDSHIVFRQRLEGNSAYRERTIHRDDILTVVITIDPEALEIVGPENPRTYRDLAEELGVQSRDPEARDLALRLYLLGARHGDRHLRESCFRGMLPLARSPGEEMSFRVLAWQTLGDEARWLESAPSRTELEPGVVDEERQVQLRDILRQWRMGDRTAMVGEIEKPWLRETLGPFASICSWQDIRRWAAESELRTESLARVLELEIALGRPAGQINRDQWSYLIHRNHARFGPVNFDTVTDFDLSKSVYRDGHWVEPAKGTSDQSDR